MSKRKYSNFIFQHDDDDFFETPNWKSVFREFQRCATAIIWGLPNKPDANFVPIMSK